MKNQYFNTPQFILLILMEPDVKFIMLLIFTVSVSQTVKSSDGEVLLGLKSVMDSENMLKWEGKDFCSWDGVKECNNGGRVTKLVLEYLNLSGTLNEKSLNLLDQLRVLSFKGNSVSGQIPDLSGLANLKSLYLSNNNFSGEFPASISVLHRLKVVVLANNKISGTIPPEIVNIRRLYALSLENNLLTGEIPFLNQTSLSFFNVSNNQLSGEIPLSPALIRFNETSFVGNVHLCGKQIKNPCKVKNPTIFPPSISPISPKSKSKHHPSKKMIIILASSIGGVLLLLICSILLCVVLKKKRKSEVVSKNKSILDIPREEGDQGRSSGAGPGTALGGGGGGDSAGKEVGFSWEAERLGKLVFVGEGKEQMSYSLEELLKASAETLGRGTMGSTYKAVMESGFIVTVKRLKDGVRFSKVEDFTREMVVIGRLKHPNLVPLRAYFHTKDERLLVYDYFPNGSLFSLIHGSRTSASGKPLHWTSCLKIAEDLATGLLYIHQTANQTHGNLKSSNVLLGSDFESCLTDYGLTAFRDLDSPEEPSASSLFYRAPECRDTRKPMTQQADIYSFGVLLLELLTGKTPFQDLVQEHGSDIPAWVRSVRAEETESADEPSSGNEASEEKLTALLNVAMACVSLLPENRPVMKDVLRMIREVRAEAQVSSNSSDHSPGRWSDTVQSLPREQHELSI